LQYSSLDARAFTDQLLRQLQHLHLEGRPQAAAYAWQEQGGTNTWEPVLAVLADCTALTELRLSQLHDPRSTSPHSVAFMPGLQDLDADAAAGRGALAAAAAAAVAAAAAAFAALTASTHLQTLHLSNVSLTPGAWAHIFPAGQQLPSLRDIKLSNCKQALDSTAVAQMVSCCPGLTALCLSGALQLSASVRPLLWLHRLRQLQLLQRVEGDTVEVLAHLESLEGLDTGQCMGHNLRQMAQSTQHVHYRASYLGRCQHTVCTTLSVHGSHNHSRDAASGRTCTQWQQHHQGPSASSIRCVSRAYGLAMVEQQCAGPTAAACSSRHLELQLCSSSKSIPACVTWCKWSLGAGTHLAWQS
jgi:hypothetical protein